MATSEENDLLTIQNEIIVDENVDEQEIENPKVEFSFGTFWNWFLPSCSDVWSSSSSLNQEIFLAYGAKSFLFLADIIVQKSKKHSTNNDTKKWKIHYREIVNVFGTKAKSQHFDVFRSNSSYITTVVFDKTFSMIKHGSSKNMNQKIYATSCAMIFLGNSDGVGALYDCHRRITLLQNLPFSAISRQCCKTVAQKKILSAAWLHYQSEGPIVYYSLDTHIIVWKVKKNEVKILHDNNEDCQNSRFNSGQLQIACLASLPAECCPSSSDKNEHKLAIGYMGGKIVIIGFDSMTGDQTTSLTIFAENGHNDDICSLSFSSYSLSSHQSYRQGLLCSVSRDSVLKVWSCSNQNEIAEHRIVSNYHGSNQKASGSSQTNMANWFTAGFMPRSCVKHSNVAYEIVLTNSSGDLLTFTLPEKGLNSKLRIGKTNRTFQSKTMSKNQPMNHTFIIFSIAMDLEHKIAITNSLDYKLILWNLSTRTSETVFYSFSNGALAIDCCQSDKRIAIAFGSNIFVLDFTREATTNDDEDDDNHHYDIQVQRLQLSSKTRFFNVIWNRKYYERLGRLIIATLDGELIHYDLNSKDIVFKSSKVNTRDTSKIYSIIWLDTLLLDENQNDHQSSPVVLTLHQSGKILVNYLSNNNDNNSHRAQENFDKYLVGVPENQKIKRTALLTSDEQKYLLMGNDDGTVDVFCRIVEPPVDDKAFRHLYRFRSFNRPCLSIEYCSRTNYLAITALHEKYINCYRLDDLDNNTLPCVSSSNIDGEDDDNDDSKLVVKTVPIKCRLKGHEDRVSFTCWSPFNRIEDIDEKILLASASYDTTCIIWNIAKRIPLKRFFGHKSLIYSIKWCHFNADFLFSGSEDNFFFWNWTIQPDFSNATDKQNVKINSLRSLLENNINNGEDSGETTNDAIANVPDEASFDSTISSLSSEISKLKNLANTKTLGNKSSSLSVPIKALFSLNNQIENNSSKYEHLEDIKWLIQLKKSTTAVTIPPNKLDRILLYGQFEHIERLLELEIENHKKNKNLEGQYVLSLFLNARSCVEKLLEQNECDPILAMIASSFSRKLYENCIRNILGESSSSNNSRVQQIQLNSKMKWTNYSKELCALIRICCLNEFHVSIDSLLAQNLFREAIILSVIHLASDTFVNKLFYQWHEYRLKQNNYEGAIKCLISGGHYVEAIELLKQRRTLCTETSGNSILRQYDEIIEQLKKVSIK